MNGSFVVAAFLATIFFASSQTASEESGNLRSAIKSFLDVDHENVQNAALSQVHAAGVSELRALQKEVHTIVKQDVNIFFFKIHEYIR